MAFAQVLEVASRLLIERAAEGVTHRCSVVHEVDAVAQSLCTEKLRTLTLLNNVLRCCSASSLLLAVIGVFVEGSVRNFLLSLKRRAIESIPDLIIGLDEVCVPGAGHVLA